MWYMRSGNIVNIQRIGRILVGIRESILFYVEGDSGLRRQGVAHATVQVHVEEYNEVYDLVDHGVVFCIVCHHLRKDGCARLSKPMGTSGPR